MKNYIDNILFAALIAVISVGVVALYYINKSGGPESSATSASSVTSGYKHPTVSTNANTVSTFNSPNPTNYQNFAMPEPFAATAPFEFTPAAWMQMMSNMMNNMQMTQMMHQMAAMPTQMMNPTMGQMSGMLPNSTSNPSQQPMDPVEYKKWYEQQLELQQSSK